MTATVAQIPEISSASRVAASARRYRPLGGFRFFLALLVVVQHFQHLLRPEQSWLLSRAGLGAVAVAVFFVVSGFVVAEANAVFYAGRPGAFLANRLLRVVPPYFAALAVSVAVHALLWRHGHLALWDYAWTGAPLDPLLLTGGVLGLVPGFHTRLLGADFEFIPFVWSLRVEMAFYGAAWLVLVAGRNWPGAVPAGLAAGLLASAGFLLLHRPGLLSTGPMFLGGVGLCLWLRRPGWVRFGFVAASSLLVFGGFASWVQHGAPVLVWQIVLLAALLGGFAWLAQRATPGWVKPLDQALGDLSYPLYLNHYAVGLALYNLTPARGLAVFVIAFVVSLALAGGMARLVDVPLRKARDVVRRVAL